MDPESQGTCKTKKMPAYLILVGLLFFCRLPLSQCQACRPNLLENVNFPGEDITSLYSPDAEHCQKLCTQYPKCFFFTFYRADWTRDNRNFYCYLKFNSSGEPSAQTPRVGVTSGFSLKTCNPEKLLCLSKVYTDMAFLGTDYQFMFASSYEACQKSCTQDPVCQFFTFMKGNYKNVKLRHKCHLKYSTSVPRIPDVDSLSDVVSGLSNRIQVHQNFTNACQSTDIQGDVTGTVLDSLPAASLQHCRALCSVHPCCSLFSYNNYSYTCELKRNTAVTAVSSSNTTSGFPAFQCLMADSWVTAQHDGINFKGCGFRTVQGADNATACQSACNADRNCQFYTYVKQSFSDTSQRKRCYLKRVITMPVPLKVIALQQAVSGFSTNICL